MRTDRIKQRLNVNTSKLSLNEDTFMKVNLENTSRLLPYDEINRTVNLGDRFDLERKRSSFYRIIGSINSTATNALFNLNDTQNGDLYTWSVFNTIDFLDTSYPRDNNLLDKTDLNYSKAVRELLLERDGWFGYFDPDITKSALCGFIDMEPKRERFSFVNDVNPYHSNFNGVNFVKNWELTITYPKQMDKTHYLVNSNGVNGLLIVDVKQVIVSNRSMMAFGVPCKHNLKVGDTVILTGTTAAYDGQWVVSRTGLEDGTMKDNYFILDIQTVVPIGPNTRMIRVSAGFNSEYYFRIFKKIKTRIADTIETDDYETYKLGFSENIYTDPLSQFVFNEDIDVADLTDNLGRPLSELYLTVIKTDSNGLFTNVSSGIDSPYIETLNNSNTSNGGHLINVPIINKIHNGGNTPTSLPFPSHTALENNVTINNNNSIGGNDYYYGDLVEYNKNTLKEVVLAEVNHRFNTRNRQAILPVFNAIVSEISNGGFNTTPIILGPRQEGYFYKAHHLIKIRQFSDYIETGVLGLDEIPKYAENMGDGRYNWRDLLDIGFNETDNNALDYPFTNGSHYLYQNFPFNVRRQDPFNLWNLFHTSYPSDPIGQSITTKFNVNSTDNDC